MGVFDWAELGGGAAGHEFPNWPGAYSCTIGDAFGGILGGRQTHLFGSDIKLVTDLEDIILNAIPNADLFLSFLSGIGGNVTFCYGSNITATYIGPKVEIRRAPEWKKISDSLTGTGKYTGPGTLTHDQSTGAADPAVKIFVGVASLLLNATSLACQIAIRVCYQKFGSKNAADQEDIEHYGVTPHVLSSLLGIVTTRCMALIKWAEQTCSLADFAEEFLHGLKVVASKLAVVPLFALSILAAVGGGLVAQFGETAAARAEAAVKALCEATESMAKYT